MLASYLRRTRRRSRLRLWRNVVAVVFTTTVLLGSLAVFAGHLPTASADVLCLNSKGLFAQCPAPGSARVPAAGSQAPVTTVPTGPTKHLTSDGIQPVHDVAEAGYVVLAIALLVTVGIVLARRIRTLSREGHLRFSVMLHRSHETLS